MGQRVLTSHVVMLSLSICRSLFGGQVLSFTGSGFGENPDLIGVSLGSRPCDVVSVEDDEIVCVTSPATDTHQVNNNR